MVHTKLYQHDSLLVHDELKLAQLLSDQNAFIQETGSSSTWTRKQNKLFENALADQDENAPDRWQNIAKASGKTVEEVKKHYQELVDDLELIESGKVPLPNYENNNAANPKPEP
ncbi:hypothetical protein L6452_39298 [Arctium lappa]|uniref:Uncharacterized protein n=1 Tax=Arctium lappa TaxID=4217 RepID=A0ACB8XSC4_ARCLA|nr:hypothetical protein L6452_39298 [Arctium lappa]